MAATPLETASPGWRTHLEQQDDAAYGEFRDEPERDAQPRRFVEPRFVSLESRLLADGRFVGVARVDLESGEADWLPHSPADPALCRRSVSVTALTRQQFAALRFAFYRVHSVRLRVRRG